MFCIVAVAAKQPSSLPRFFITSRSVLGSPHSRSFHRVYPAAGHDVCPSRQLVLVHLFENFHALQKIEMFLTSLLLRRHCHVLVRRSFPPSSQGGDSFRELVEELRL